MFILTQMNTTQGVFGVFDTSDGTNEMVSIPVLAERIRNHEITVKGIKASVVPGSTALPQYGISISVAEAKDALDRYRRRI